MIPPGPVLRPMELVEESGIVKIGGRPEPIELARCTPSALRLSKVSETMLVLSLRRCPIRQ